MKKEYIYVMAKLTLHVNEELITLAKQEAHERGVSVSKLVSDFFVVLSHQQPKEKEVLPPLTQSLVGALKGGDSDHEEYVDYLEGKHA